MYVLIEQWSGHSLTRRWDMFALTRGVRLVNVTSRGARNATRRRDTIEAVPLRIRVSVMEARPRRVSCGDTELTAQDLKNFIQGADGA